MKAMPTFKRVRRDRPIKVLMKSNSQERISRRALHIPCKASDPMVTSS
jgi:hypothetical protein